MHTVSNQLWTNAFTYMEKGSESISHIWAWIPIISLMHNTQMSTWAEVQKDLSRAELSFKNLISLNLHVTEIYCSVLGGNWTDLLWSCLKALHHFTRSELGPFLTGIFLSMDTFTFQGLTCFKKCESSLFLLKKKISLWHSKPTTLFLLRLTRFCRTCLQALGLNTHSPCIVWIHNMSEVIRTLHICPVLYRYHTV